MVVLLDTTHVRGGGTLVALFDREFDAVAFHQAAEPTTLNGRKMYKDIVATFAGNEAVAFLVVKPLHSADFAIIHLLKLSYYYKTLKTGLSAACLK